MNRGKRRFALFLATVVVPAALLAVLMFRFLRQDEELSRQRAEDARRTAAEQMGRELAARLDAIQLAEINRRMGKPGGQPGQSADSSIIFATTWNGDRMTLPWEAASNAFYPSAQFAALLDQGDMLEFRQMDFPAAAAVYSQALSLSKQPEEACEARLSLGRVLLKAEKAGDALQVYREMLAMCGAVLDNAGLPFSFYAADRLIERKLNVGAAEEYLVREVHAVRLRPLPQLQMLRTLVQKVGSVSATQAVAEIDIQIREVRRTLTLAGEFAELKTAAGNTWMGYGEEPWLLRWRPASPPVPPLLFAVSSRGVAPPGTKLVVTGGARSYTLGPGFPNLKIELISEPAASRSPLAEFFPAAIIIILVLTIFAGYLLLIGISRDLQMAEMRSQFVASVSHELKTPLTAIRAFTETLVLGRVPDERTRSEYLETLMNESERLGRLVDNVLDFSKIEQGKKIYRMRPAALPGVVLSAARAMQYPLEQQGFELQVDVDYNLPEISADADALEQAILNLLSNAMKYSGASRQIQLTCARTGQDAVIAVTDRGIGIASGDQSRIFEKFYRVTSPETHLIAGTGLGLTLVKHIAGAHGGSIEVKSAPGQGSTFSIRIPLPASTAGPATEGVPA